MRPPKNRVKQRTNKKQRWTAEEKKQKKEFRDSFKMRRRSGNNMELNILEQLHNERGENYSGMETGYTDPSGSGVLFNNDQFVEHAGMEGGEGDDLRSLLNKRR